MCGRQRVTEASLQAAASYAGMERSEIPPQVSTRENMGPSAWSAVCTKGYGGSNNTKKILAAKWGLITPWDKDINHFNLFNARSETADKLNSFKRLFKGKDAKRGIIFMDGFYEWCGEKCKLDGKKQPYYFYREDGEPMIAAVLYNYSSELETNTYTMITRQSFGKMKPMHSREPLLLTVKSVDLWLGSDSDVDRLLEDEAACTEVLEKSSKFHPVTKKMGLVAYQENDCATPIEARLKSPVRSHNIASFFCSGAKKPADRTSSTMPTGSICSNSINDNGSDSKGDTSLIRLNSPSTFAAKKNSGHITSFFGGSAAGSGGTGQKRGKEREEEKEEKEEEEEKEKGFKKARLDPVGKKERGKQIVDLT